jgi:hypothetical protein
MIHDNTRVRRRIATAMLAGCLLLGGPVAAQDWFPSKYGADDEIGAANLLSPEKVLEAAQLITTGKTYALGVPVGRDTPACRSPCCSRTRRMAPASAPTR